jgi:hypothetical protein
MPRSSSALTCKLSCASTVALLLALCPFEAHARFLGTRTRTTTPHPVHLPTHTDHVEPFPPFDPIVPDPDLPTFQPGTPIIPDQDPTTGLNPTFASGDSGENVDGSGVDGSVGDDDVTLGGPVNDEPTDSGGWAMEASDAAAPTSDSSNPDDKDTSGDRHAVSTGAAALFLTGCAAIAAVAAL